MRSRFSHLALIGLAALAGAVEASPTSDMLAVRRGRDKSVKMGVWHADLAKAKAYAEKNAMPLIAVWSNGEDCSHCLVFERMAMSPVFTEWMKTSGYVFYFGVRDDGPSGPTPDGQEGYHGTSFYWCRMKNGSYDPNASRNFPYVRIYWRKANGSLKVDRFETGAALDGEYDALPMPAPRNCTDNPKKFVVKGDDGTFNPSARYFIDKLTNKDYGYLRSYVYNPTPSYEGGEFGVADGSKNPDSRMEIEYGTSVESVMVPLTRTNTAAQASVATNFLAAVYPSGKAKTNTVAWAKGSASANVAVKIVAGWLGEKKPGSRIELLLLNDKKAVVEKNYIYCVDPVGNSPKNPSWIGERTAATLGWGEWTMDIDVAKAKVKAYNSQKGNGAKAYTLLLFSGSLWCPDCVNMEEYITSSAEFKAWADGDKQKIACVAVDVPPIKLGETEAPCLLSWHTAATAVGKKYFPGVSGAGWLSRHGVPLSGNGGVNAQTILERSLNFAQKDTQHGGYLLPGQERMGVPTFVLLRENGTVSGRISRFAVTSDPLKMSGAAAQVVRRLTEMLAQDADAREENNDGWQASGDTIGVRAKRKSTVSFADAADYYRVEAKAGTDVFFELGTDDPASKDAQFVLSVIDSKKVREVSAGKWVNVADQEPVSAVTNTLANGPMTFVTLPSDDCYVKVSYPVDKNGYPTQSRFSLGNAGTTLCPYVLSSSGIIRASDVLTVAEFTDDNPEVQIYLTKGQTYRFTGIDESDKENLAQIEKEISGGAWTGRWVSKVTTAASLKLVKTGGKLIFGYQYWAPGVVGFERTSWSMAEPKDEVDCVVNIRRTGGLSGWAKAKLSLDKGNSTPIDDGSVYEWSDEGRVLVWGEGTNDTLTTVIRVKVNGLADGDQKVTLKLTRADGGDATVADDYASFTLTIRDDDEPIPGVLSIRSVNGLELPDSRRIFAKGGSRLTVVAQRSGGAAGDVTGRLSASKGSVFWAESRTWPSRDNSNKTFTLTLPAYSEVKSHRVMLRLSGVDGSRVDSAANYLLVELTPENAPELVESSELLSATRYVNAGLYEIAVNIDTVNLLGGAITAEKSAGSLPPGVRWEFDDTYQERSFNVGRVVLSGTPTAAGVYTAYFRVSQDGLTGPACAVTINVTDPATQTKEESSEANPFVARARTYADMVVVDTNANRIAGLVTLTIPPSGRLSARYRKIDGTSVSLLSESWSSCVKGDYFAQLSSVAAGSDAGYGLSAVVRTTGKVVASVTDPQCECPLVCIVPERNWSKANPATTWKGYYTVSMPNENPSALACGDAYVTLRMETEAAVNAGRVMYAGLLPNGKSFSGTSTLFESDRVGVAESVLPVFKTSTADSFAALYALDPLRDSNQKVWAYDGLKAVWRHSSEAEDASYEATFGIYGCLYQQQDLVECCTNKFGKQELTFFATTTNLPPSAGFARNLVDIWSTRTATVSVSSRFNADGSFQKSYVVLADPSAAQRENGLTLTWNRTTGLVTGELRLDFRDGASATARYAGVMMPNWGTLDCAACSDSRCDLRPFVSGACWFADTFTNDAGVSTHEIRGVPFSIGVIDGK